ncbi:radical SAM protein [Kutzneria sp. 744]|uniref:radical SAM protein n=1 Tax=Kutzneria sp. (strain 744) TaxID=345341 RepID=UPI0004B282B8|nr:radical SAM protein [Kutzneria sp. 744]
MRFIRGAAGYWAVGSTFVARVPEQHFDAQGRPTPAVRELLAARDAAPATDSDLYGLTVLVTTRCNLACPYCFQNTELPQAPEGAIPLRIPGATVDDRKVADILAFTRDRMAELNKTAVKLMLFGGEPTMFPGYCLKLLEGCRPLGLTGASMISNGTLFDAAGAIEMERAGLEWVQISLDGDAADHDRSRITLGGRGTFATILRNVEAASARTALKWRLRVNISRESIDGVQTLIDRLGDRLDTGRFMLKLALIQDVGIGYQKSVRHSAELAKRVGELYLHAMDAGFTVAPPRAAPCLFCDAVGGTTGAVVNSDGTLYSCCHSAGQDGYDVGTVTAGYHREPVVRERWVMCGYGAEPNTDKAAERLHADIVDAIVLDRLHATGSLAAATASQFALMDPA